MPTKKKKVSAKKAAPRKAKPARKISAKKSKVSRERATASPREAMLGNNHRERKLNPFTRKQKEKLLQLRDAMVDSMAGVAQDTLRSRAEGSEASAFGMHQADAGSDAYDRDFALSLLSQEQDALYEIDQALKRGVNKRLGTRAGVSAKGERPKSAGEAEDHRRRDYELKHEGPGLAERFNQQPRGNIGDDHDRDDPAKDDFEKTRENCVRITRNVEKIEVAVNQSRTRGSKRSRSRASPSNANRSSKNKIRCRAFANQLHRSSA